MAAHRYDDGHQHPAPGQDPAGFWEEKYGQAESVWSGRVTPTLLDIGPTLTPGRSLDLGSGEGADVIYLVGLGWEATGIDISPTAVERARQVAQDQGVTEDQAHFLTADLADPDLDWGGDYDLVTASFLQSPVELDRESILRRAARSVAPGGHLLVTAHAGVPPWAADHEHDGEHPGHHQSDEPMPTPESDLEALRAAGGEWSVHIAEIRTRQTTGPNGEPDTLEDSVVLIQRVD